MRKFENSIYEVIVRFNDWTTVVVNGLDAKYILAGRTPFLKNMTVQEMHDWVFTDLGFCGCGDPEAALDLMRSVLSTINSRSERNRQNDSAHEEWMTSSREIEKMIGMETSPAVAWTYLYFLDGQGLLEHGSNITGSWLTDKGKEILALLNTFTSKQIIDNDEEEDILNAKVIDG